jgi:hypothetical protein
MSDEQKPTYEELEELAALALALAHVVADKARASRSADLDIFAALTALVGRSLFQRPPAKWLLAARDRVTAKADAEKVDP